MTVAYVTKYALTKGIIEFEGTVKDGMFITNQQWPQYFHGNDWHYTRPDAIKKANEMVSKKIDSLRRELNKLERTKF